MSSGARSGLGGLLVAAAVGGGLYWLVGVPTLALAAGLAWGTAVGVTVHLAARFPDRETGTDWAASRWTGLGIGVMTFAGLLGVNAVSGLSTEVRFGLGAVVLGVGYATFTTGTMAELERTIE